MSTATQMLAKYLAAEELVLEGKEAKIGDRSFRLEDLAQIREGRKEWEGKVAAERRAASGVNTFGGLSYGRARMDRD